MKSNDIRLEDLTENMKHVAELIGFENLIRLIKTFGGEFLYISTLNAAGRGSRNREIKRLLKKGKSYKEVANLHNISTIAVRVIDKEIQ